MQTHALVLGSACTGRRGLQGLQAFKHVDLLGGLPLCFQLLEGLDRPRLDPRKAVEFEHASQLIQNVRLNDASGGKPLGETGQ